jgi:hypothetical protein
VGRTFWKTGDLCQPEPSFDGIAELNTWAGDGDHEDNNLPCEMFEMEDGKAVCMIEFVYSYKAKPITCRNYPELTKTCMKEQL